MHVETLHKVQVTVEIGVLILAIVRDELVFSGYGDGVNMLFKVFSCHRECIDKFAIYSHVLFNF